MRNFQLNSVINCGYFGVHLRGVMNMRVRCALALLALCAARADGTRFASHVSVSTPARSFTHGVGDPLPSGGSGARPQHFRSRAPPPGPPRQPPRAAQRGPAGYSRQRPAVPFYQEEVSLGNSLLHPLWQDDIIKSGTIPVLPASPYRVNSPNPESLWPEGLFVPPSIPLRGFGISNVHLAAKIDNSANAPEDEAHDPYLLSDADALQALDVIRRHGELFFHDIPHRRSLLDNQQMRIDNHLEPHRLGSIRHMWIYFRP